MRMIIKHTYNISFVKMKGRSIVSLTHVIRYREIYTNESIFLHKRSVMLPCIINVSISHGKNASLTFMGLFFF
jgi:hypothetical protein